MQPEVEFYARWRLKKLWGAHVRVHTQSRTYDGENQAAGTPRAGGTTPRVSWRWHKGHRHPRESSASMALSQAPRPTTGEVWKEQLLSEAVGTYGQAAKRSEATEYQRARSEPNSSRGETAPETLSPVTCNLNLKSHSDTNKRPQQKTFSRAKCSPQHKPRGCYKFMKRNGREEGIK